MPGYSVIVPAYNAAETLERLLVSLETQTFRDIEVIVVDDASTDGTERVVQGRPVRYERLQQNMGPATARNRGAALAQGEWLVFTDADTEFLPDTMECLDRVLRGSGADALVGSYSHVPANSGFVPRYKALWEYAVIDLGVKTDKRGLARISTWAPRPGVVRREAFENVGGFDTRFRGADLEDMELGYRLAAAGYRIYAAPALRIRHHYPATIMKELRPFARRAALWMSMMRSRLNFDTTGEGSPRQALAHLAGFTALGALAFSLVFRPALILFAGLMTLYCALNARFLRLAWREMGMVFTIQAFLYCWLHTLVLGFAAGYGLLFRKHGD